VTRAFRRFGLGLATLLAAPRGWFIPHRYAGSAAPRASYPALEPCFAEADADMQDLLRDAGAFAAEFARFGGTPPAPRFEQDWFPRLDAIVAYTLLRRRAPPRIVEIGSGHSTRVLARAIADGGLATKLTAIDPAPRADLAGLAIDIIRAPIQQAPEAASATLRAGDFLCIDSSHVLMPGSDVDLLFNHIMPSLPAGVLVHVHDVFLPDAYPESWRWRGYNEQNALACLLTGGAWRIVWTSRYVVTRRPEWITASVAAKLPLQAGAYESSLWLERR